MDPNSTIESRFESHRKRTQTNRFRPGKLAGLALLILFPFGLWMLRGTILYDLERMFTWQKIMFWTGDVFAYLYVLRWVLLTTASAQPVVNPNDADSRERRTISGRAFAFLMLLSLLIDVGITTISHSSEYRGMQRAVDAIADVQDISTSVYRDADHYRFEISFVDLDGQRIETGVSLAQIQDQRVRDWKVAPINVAKGQMNVRTIDVAYDPQLSKRVWFKNQPWKETTSIAVIFTVIHIFQLVVFYWTCGSLFSARAKPIGPDSILHLTPLAAETAFLLFFGSMLHTF